MKRIKRFLILLLMVSLTTVSSLGYGKMCDNIKNLFPKANIDIMNSICSNKKLFIEYGITTDTRFRMFIAQMAHESGGFRYTRELKYKNKSFEDKYGYKTRIGKILGNTQKGDGEKYFGRGLIQLTGKWNYKYYGNLIGIDLLNNPELAEKPIIALEIALMYWKKKGLNKHADTKNMLEITKIINGGTKGLTSRIQWYHRVKNISLSNLNY